MGPRTADLKEVSDEAKQRRYATCMKHSARCFSIDKKLTPASFCRTLGMTLEDFVVGAELIVMEQIRRCRDVGLTDEEMESALLSDPASR